MRAKSKFFKRVGALALALGMVFGTLAVNARPVSAAAGFQVADKKYEKSYKLDDGKTYFEAKGVFPQIKGNSKAAKKINRELEKEKNAWIEKTKKNASDAKEFFDSYSSRVDASMPEWNYSDDITYEVTNNDGKYFSVVMSDYLYQGGAHGSPDRIAMTFDAKTGQKLTATKLLGTTKAKMNAKARKLYLKKYDKEGTEAGFYGEGESGRAALEKTLSSRNFNNKFYVRDGSIVFYADPYVLGPYAAGFIEVSTTI